MSSHDIVEQITFAQTTKTLLQMECLYMVNKVMERDRDNKNNKNERKCVWHIKNKWKLSFYYAIRMNVITLTSDGNRLMKWRVLSNKKNTHDS